MMVPLLPRVFCPAYPLPPYFGLLLFLIKRLPTHTFFEKLCLSLHPSYPLLSVVSLPYVLMTLYIAVVVSYYTVIYLPIDFLPIAFKVHEVRDIASHHFLISHPQSA